MEIGKEEFLTCEACGGTDWRKDPNGLMKTSNPPIYVDVYACIKCGHKAEVVRPEELSTNVVKVLL